MGFRSNGRNSMGEIGWSGFRSNGRNSMGEIGWSGFRSNGRNSMGEIGLVVVRVSEIFLEITQKSSGGPHTNSSALKEIAIFRNRKAQHTKWDQKAHRVSPEIFTSAAGAMANACSNIHAQLDSCPAWGLSRKPSHTLFLSEQRYLSQLPPRSNWTDAALYGSGRTRGGLTNLPHHTALS